MKQKDLSVISYQSTKQELWSAYKQLKQLVEEQAKKTTHPLTSKTKPDWRQQLLKVISQLDSQFQEKEEEFHSLREQIAQAQDELKNLYQIKAKAQTLIDLEEKISSLENLWQRKQKQLEEEFKQEKVWHQKRLAKEDEEKRFNLEFKRRRIEQEIIEKQKDWQEKEKHYQALQQETDRFPEILEQTREKVSKELTEQLKKEFAQEKEVLGQKHQAEQNLLEQQIKNQREKAKRDEQQIKSLTHQLNEAHQKIKEMAVAALENKSSKQEKSASN